MRALVLPVVTALAFASTAHAQTAPPAAEDAKKAAPAPPGEDDAKKAAAKKLAEQTRALVERRVLDPDAGAFDPASIPGGALADTEVAAALAGATGVVVKPTLENVKVGISPIAPFVLLDKEHPRGYGVDLWRALSTPLGSKTRFVTSTGVKENLARLTRGEIDIALGAISITKAREEAFDFSHPIYRAGLGILMRSGDASPSWWDTLKGGLSKTRSSILLGFLALIVIAGHLIWLAERGADMFSDKYVPGIFEGMYWAIVTASTVGYGDKAPVRWPGRVLAGLVIVVSLPMFAVFTAELASAITVEAVTTSVRGPSDLSGKKVAVLRGTTGATEAARYGARLHTVDNLAAATTALTSGAVEAVVHDAPALSHFAMTTGKGAVEVVGPPFAPSDVALVMRDGDPRLESINRALLALTESGDVRRMQVEWFGK